MPLTNFPNGITVAGFNPPVGVTFTIGAEAANVINVAVQLTDGNGDALNNACAVAFYLSDDDGGAGLTAAAPAGGIAIGTDGALVEMVANAAGYVLADATGAADVDMTHATGAATWYLVVVLPDGNYAVSGAITFAA